MVINLSYQTALSPALPPQCAVVFVNSSLPLAFVGVPKEREDGEVTGLTVTITNPDAMPVTAPCEKVGDAWIIYFAPSCFPTYGFVEKGYKVVATIKTKLGTSLPSTLAVGDVEVKSDSASAQPGDPSKSYQVKGADIYVKSTVVDEVQHYKKQTISYDAEMGAWGADWTGDYILVDGEFVDATPSAPIFEEGEPNDAL